MLEWLVHECPPTTATTMRETFKQRFDIVEMVMHRGPLVKIAATPYARDNDEGWSQAYVKYKGVIFAMAQYTDVGMERSQELERSDPGGHKYWGQKFEQLITRDTNSVSFVYFGLSLV